MAAILHNVFQALVAADTPGGLLDIPWLPYEVILFVAVVCGLTVFTLRQLLSGRWADERALGEAVGVARRRALQA